MIDTHGTRQATRGPAVVQQFREGDPATVSWVATLVSKIVKSRGYYIPATQRPDVIQDAMLAVWQRLSGPNFVLKDTFEGLVGTVAHRRCVDWVRRQRRLEASSDGLDEKAEIATNDPSQEARIYEAQRQALASRVLAELREGCRELIYLHAHERRTYAEIARILDRSEGGLRVQMVNCLKNAREILERVTRRGNTPTIAEETM